MTEPFSIPVRIVANPPGMSEFAKTLLSAGIGAAIGLVAGLISDPLRRYFEDKRAVAKSTRLLHGSTQVQFSLMTQLYDHLDRTIRELPPLPKDEFGNSTGPEVQAILDNDQHRIFNIGAMCSDFNTDIYDHYYGGDKVRYYDIPQAEAITVFFDYIARLKQSPDVKDRMTANLMLYEMNRAIYGLLKNVDSDSEDKKFLHSLQNIKEENMPPQVIG